MTRKYRDTDPALYAAWCEAENAQQKALKKYGPQSAEFELALAVAEGYWAQLQVLSKGRGKKKENQSQKNRAFGR